MQSTKEIQEVQEALEPHERLRHARSAAGYNSARKAAFMNGWKPSTYAAHENGQNKFDLKIAVEYSKAFKVDPLWLLAGGKKLHFLESREPGSTFDSYSQEFELQQDFLRHSEHLARAAAPNAKAADPEALDNLSKAEMHLDVPVLGVTVGGDDHDFTFNGITVDYVRRPPGIAKARAAYATYVVGESMYPAHREGSLVYVNPDKPPAVGDDVVIELYPKDEASGPGAGYIKRLKKRTSTRLIVEQFNPPGDIEFDLADVKSVHRIVPWGELLGI